MTPSEFWRLHPAELWWLIDARRPRRTYAGMTEDDMAELHDWLKEQALL